MDSIKNEVLRIKIISLSGLNDSVREFGKSYLHVAATSTINCIIDQGSLNPEEKVSCVRSALAQMNALYVDPSIPWETEKARLIREAEQKAESGVKH